jgi:hypothetical protein
VGQIATFLVVKVHGWVRAFTGSRGSRLLVVIEPTEALWSRPCFQQSSIHGKVLVR